MGYVTREMIDRAKKMDLLTYLQTYEPQELVHFGGNTYCTCNTQPFCMGRTVDFSGGIVYDKNGSVGTRGRKVNHVRGCCVAVRCKGPCGGQAAA